MKKLTVTMATLILFTLSQVFAHSDAELGPSGGRIVEFSTNQTLHGEVTLTNGQFRVSILDKNMKPVTLTEQTLSVIGGDRKSPEKPKVEKQGNQFVFPALKGNSYLVVLQFKESPSAKQINARFEYDSSI